MPNKVCRTRYPLCKRNPAHQSRRNDRRERIPRPRAVTSDLRVVKRASASIRIEIGTHILVRMKPRDDNRARSHRRNCRRHPSKFILRHKPARRIIRPEQLARLREVRGHYVRLWEQLTHLRTKCGCIGGVEAAVVPHHRINNQLRCPLFEPCNTFQHHLDLTLRAEKARQNRIKFECVRRPVLHIGAHTICIVVEIVIRKARMYR